VKPAVDEKKRFKDYSIGYVHIDITEIRLDKEETLLVCRD